MARNIGVDINESKPVYRGVVLYLYPGMRNNHTLREYTAADGRTFSYHESRAFGPYETRGPATSQVTSELNTHEAKKENTINGTQRSWHGTYGHGIPEVTAFVESQQPSWIPIDGTFREA